jgi:chaperonin GroES
MVLAQSYDLEKLMEAPNAATFLVDADRSKIGQDAVAGFQADNQSRERWLSDMAEAMKLTLQVVEEKSEPWAGASNVKFPLVTIAALQFHARVYPLLVPGPNVAKCRVIGLATEGKISRASRVGTHMSWQLLEQDTLWEENHDKALLVEAIMGDVFKKSYFDSSKRHTVCEMVSPGDLVVNYWTKCTVDESPRATHIKTFTRNQIVERVRKGFFFDRENYSDGQAVDASDPLTAARNDREGVQPPPLDYTTPCTVYEQLCWYDLDGDGYAEPYIATVEQDGTLRRLIARFVESGIQRNDKDQITKISPIPIYTRYGLIPAPDGGFYSLGFGRLLGPINESANTALNQLFDAGTLSNYGGGFLGRGARFRGGQYTFKPQEWKQVDSPGDDLRKNIVPLPVREPSDVLFKLLGFLVQYGERIASANDLQMGENIGQNTPAETARTMNQNGQRVLAAMYKRQWRSFRDELRVRYELNKVYLQVDEDYENLTTGEGAIIRPDDYMGPSTDVRPVADPIMVDDITKIQDAAEIMGAAYKLPNFNKYLSTRRWLEAKRTPDIDQLYPAPKPPEGAPPGMIGDIQVGPDVKMLEVEVKQKAQALKEMEFKFEQAQWQTQMQMEVQEDQRELQLIQAQIYKLYADATKAMAEAKGVQTGHQVGILQAQMTGVEAQVRVLELQQQRIDNRVKEKLGRLKIIEAVAKTTGVIDGVASKINDRRREEGVASESADEAPVVPTTGLGAGSMPFLG